MDFISKGMIIINNITNIWIIMWIKFIEKFIFKKIFKTIEYYNGTHKKIRIDLLLELVMAVDLRRCPSTVVQIRFMDLGLPKFGPDRFGPNRTYYPIFGFRPGSEFLRSRSSPDPAHVVFLSLFNFNQMKL